MVPLHLARELGCDLYPDITCARWDSNADACLVTCQEGTTLIRRRITGPALCTLGDAEAAYLRLSTLRSRMAARNREFTPWPGTDLPDTPTVTLLPQKRETVSCRFLSRDTAARHLLDALKGVEET